MFLTLCALAFSSIPLKAQEASAPPAVQDQNTPSGLDDVPDEYLIEAQNYYESCEADGNISAYYDCRCMAAQYLDTRINAGPEMQPSSIELAIGPGCMDSARIAGNTYNECLTRAPVLPLNQTVEEYCTCYANGFARIYKRSGFELSSKSKIKLQAQAAIICKDPAMGRKLYPQAFQLSK